MTTAEYTQLAQYWQDRYNQLKTQAASGVISGDLLEELGWAGFMVKISDDPARFLAQVA